MVGVWFQSRQIELQFPWKPDINYNIAIMIYSDSFFGQILYYVQFELIGGRYRPVKQEDQHLLRIWNWWKIGKFIFEVEMINLN